MNLSVVLPIYNEEENIKPLISRIEKACTNHNLEIVCVDDGSKDKSYKVLSDLKNKKVKIYRHVKNMGLGAAIKTGFSHASGDVIITMDADLTQKPEEIPLFLKKINEGYNLVIGSRYIYQGAMIGVPLKRRIISNFSNFFLRVLIGAKVNEITSGYRAITSDVIKKLNLKSDGFEIQTEMVAKASKYKVCEVPIKLGTRKFGESKLRLARTTLKTFVVVIKSRLNLI